MTKSQFRKDAIALRRAYNGTQRETAASELSAQLNAFEPLLNAKTVAAYIPFGGEINILTSLCDLISNPASHEKRILLPRVVKPHTLQFHICNPTVFCGKHAGGFFDEGYEGILEPPADWPTVPIEEIDIFLVPGVAFDKNGIRLGYGKGFYDRMLTKKREDALAIGVIFDEMLYDSLPAEDHDFRMDAIAAPNYLFSVESLSA